MFIDHLFVASTDSGNVTAEGKRPRIETSSVVSAPQFDSSVIFVREWSFDSDGLGSKDKFLLNNKVAIEHISLKGELSAYALEKLSENLVTALCLSLELHNGYEADKVKLLEKPFRELMAKLAISLLWFMRLNPILRRRLKRVRFSIGCNRFLKTR
jgi:hypothetical protein